ncbi:alpha/beta hydrolase [Agrococcus beijingensis]|uniref:alpha/beta hydrolase n=1 Tax=Agrococcus beijingensis TaxID=3068634 RepID=UPI0027417E56|nr:alpha/beta hydrolase [Agrococcus sp. REN33]
MTADPVLQAAAGGPRPAVAPPLRPALVELARSLPPLTGVDDIPRYRVAGKGRRVPIGQTAAELGLEAVELRLGGMPATALRPAGELRGRVLFLHGGGMVGGDRSSGADLLARHAAELGIEVLALDYPLAPEHSLDAMTDAVLTAVRAVAGLPLVLAGHSGGGGLAAAVALTARDADVPLDGLLLSCPMVGGAGTPSRAQFAADPSWGAGSDAAAWSAVLAGAEQARPGERDDLHGLPPTYLDVGAAELFRDDVLAFAARLLAAGNQAELHVWSGAFHASDCLVEEATVSIEAHRARREWLRRLLEGGL